jgi:hypothetical protein
LRTVLIFAMGMDGVVPLINACATTNGWVETAPCAAAHSELPGPTQPLLWTRLMRAQSAHRVGTAIITQAHACAGTATKALHVSE